MKTKNRREKVELRLLIITSMSEPQIFHLFDKQIDMNQLQEFIKRTSKLLVNDIKL